MENKKLSTQEILARARQQAGGAAPQPEKPAASSAESESKPASASAAPSGDAGAEQAKPAAPKASAGGAPKSTKDILAAARAQAGGGGVAPAAKPAGAPKSTKDILAAARAQSGSGTKSEAPGKPAAKVEAKSGVAAKPAGDRPSLEEMLKAVREGKPVEAEAKAQVGAAAPALPPRPQKPAPAAKLAAPVEKRRSVLLALLLSPFALAWTFFTMTSAVWALATARFMMPNVLVEPPSRFKVGPASDYPPGAVSTKWTAQFGVWVVHTMYKGKDLVYALQTVCTHLGCTPNWLEGEQKFKCPCHGSGFYITGVNFEGPAPRPLERMGIRVAEDGMLEVDKSVKFQEEMGQWDDPASFVQAG